MWICVFVYLFNGSMVNGECYELYVFIQKTLCGFCKKKISKKYHIIQNL